MLKWTARITRLWAWSWWQLWCWKLGVKCGNLFRLMVLSPKWQPKEWAVTAVIRRSLSQPNYSDRWYTKPPCCPCWLNRRAAKSRICGQHVVSCWWMVTEVLFNNSGSIFRLRLSQLYPFLPRMKGKLNMLLQWGKTEKCLDFHIVKDGGFTHWCFLLRFDQDAWGMESCFCVVPNTLISTVGF